MEKILLVRKEYDRLVEQRPDYMRTEYLKLKRSWCLSGVFVSGNIARLKDVLRSLEAVTA